MNEKFDPLRPELIEAVPAEPGLLGEPRPRYETAARSEKIRAVVIATRMHFPFRCSTTPVPVTTLSYALWF
jgi:hypothetical protein